MTKCLNKGCVKESFARGLCKNCYSKYVYHGRELPPKLQHGHFAGRHASPTYNSWLHMRGRCLTPTDVKYPDYGGRGITICERWDKFENFLEDMGERPERIDSLTLGRIDNDGPYCKENCEWQTAKQQANNRRKRKYFRKPQEAHA